MKDGRGGVGLHLEGGHRVALVKPVSYRWESGWGAGGSGYKTVAAAGGVGKIRFQRK